MMGGEHKSENSPISIITPLLIQRNDDSEKVIKDINSVSVDTNGLFYIHEEGSLKIDKIDFSIIENISSGPVFKLTSSKTLEII